MQLAYSRPMRPVAAGRRSVITFSSLNGAGPSPVPSRPGGASRVSVSASCDEVPSDAEGDVPTVGIRPSGGAFRGVPTSEPGTAGSVGSISFQRPGGGCTRFNAAKPPAATGGPSTPGDVPSRLDRPAGGAARFAPGGGNNGDAPGGGNGGGSGGSGGSDNGGASGDEPLGLSSMAPWALIYLGVCGALYWAHESFIKKKPAEAAPVKSCCKKAAAAAAPEAAAPAEPAGKKAGKGRKGGKGK